MNITAQYLQFIKDCKSTEELDRLEFRAGRVWDNKIPAEVKKEIEKRKNELTTK